MLKSSSGLGQIHRAKKRLDIWSSDYDFKHLSKSTLPHQMLSLSPGPSLLGVSILRKPWDSCKIPGLLDGNRSGRCYRSGTLILALDLCGRSKLSLTLVGDGSRSR